MSSTTDRVVMTTDGQVNASIVAMVGFAVYTDCATRRIEAESKSRRSSSSALPITKDHDGKENRAGVFPHAGDQASMNRPRTMRS
jgi:hypothetical protein